MVEHVVAEHRNRIREENYRIYTTDVLACLAERLGVTVNYRYRELVETHEEKPMSGDEIALMVIKRLDLKGKTNGNGLHEVESEPLA